MILIINKKIFKLDYFKYKNLHLKSSVIKAGVDFTETCNVFF